MNNHTVMKLFDQRTDNRAIVNAREYAAVGGQALHVWDPDRYGYRERAGIPRVFRDSTPWAHLFDQDAHRLEQTARRLGVRIIVIENRGRPHQHIDLCAGPLTRAMKEVER